MPNPYVPPTPSSNPPSRSDQLPSTWLRNFKAMVAVSIAYSLVCATFAFLRRETGDFVLILITISAIASAWANIQLGPRIGWNQGGFSVVIVVFIAALIAYSLFAWLVGGMVYNVIDPVTIYTPYRQ